MRQAARATLRAGGEVHVPLAHDLAQVVSRALELLQPLSPDSAVGRFLEKRGPGLHHIAYRVPDIRAALAELADQGYELIDTEPRPGAFGHQEAFLHPRSTGGVLIELVEH